MLTSFAGYSVREARKQRKALLKSIDQDFDRKYRARVAELKGKEKAKRGEKRERLGAARVACKSNVDKVRERARAVFRRAVLRASERRRATVQAARERCRANRTIIRTELDAEILMLSSERKTYIQETQANKSWERWGEKRQANKHKRSRKEIQSESDDEVLASIDPELVPYWEQVKRRTKATARMSRLDVFLHAVEENADEVLQARMNDAEKELAKELLKHQKQIDEEMEIERKRMELEALEDEERAAPKSTKRVKRRNAQRELMEFFGSLVVAG